MCEGVGEVGIVVLIGSDMVLFGRSGCTQSEIVRVVVVVEGWGVGDPSPLSHSVCGVSASISCTSRMGSLWHSILCAGGAWC